MHGGDLRVSMVGYGNYGCTRPGFAYTFIPSSSPFQPFLSSPFYLANMAHAYGLASFKCLSARAVYVERGEARW